MFALADRFIGAARGALPNAHRYPRLGRLRFTNWAGNQTRTVEGVLRPRTETAVVEAIRRARERRETLKVVGAGHSWSDIACTDGHVMSLDNVASVLAVDPRKRQITVQAGIRLHELSAALREHGMALSCLGSVSEQSIAGAIATGTHGSGIEFGNLSTQVVALRLVTGTGEVLALDREKDEETFRAACVHLGALGVVTAVTIQAEPAFNLEESTNTEPLSNLVDEPVAGQEWLDDVVHSAEHVKIWWLPHSDALRIYRANRTQHPVSPPTLQRRFDESSLSKAFFATLLRIGARMPSMVPKINRLVRHVHFVDTHRVAASEDVFNVPQVPVHQEVEFSVPHRIAAEAFQRLVRLIENENLKVDFIVELRFVKGDDFMMSPATGRDSCHIGAYMYCPQRCTRYFKRLEQIMLGFEGRPHWGKQFEATREQLEPLYPEFDTFDTLRRRLDPDGVFENDFTERVFD